MSDTYNRLQQAIQPALVQQFNAMHPVGTQVLYRSWHRDEPRVCTIATEAVVLSGVGVVWLSEVSGCVAIGSCSLYCPELVLDIQQYRP